MAEMGVSIVCNAYNHEKYIRDTLDGFLMQKTTFPIEILIHDDASTDRTPEIIKEYEEKYPDVVKPIYQTENKYSKGCSISGDFQYPRVTGKYIAFCEGDDYWTDPLKLQKQYDIMESHPDIDICTHGAVAVNADTKEVVCKITPSRVSRIMPVEEVIWGEGGYTAANSIFFRSSINDYRPKFSMKFRYQYTTKIRASLRGGMYYIADVMSSYRIMTQSSWTRSMDSDTQKWIKFNEDKKKMFELLNEETDHKYAEIIQKRSEMNDFLLLLQTGRYKEMFNKSYRHLLKELSFRVKLNIWIKAYLPGVLKIIYTVKNK